MESIKADHGYTSSSDPVVHLVKFMTQLSVDERKQFLQFVTGSPRLSFGGFKALHPPLTVVCKTVESNPDGYLPSVMTCVNYLKVPAYSSEQIMRDRFMTAMTEGQGSFHLS
jgi:E3 ubiquitin-protein ligase TRIP12